MAVDGTCATGRFDNTMATAERGEPDFDCASRPGLADTLVTNSVWFSFTAPEGPIRIQAFPDTLYEGGIQNQALQLQLFTLEGDCANLTNLLLLDCDVPLFDQVTTPSIITETLKEGQTYYLQVSGNRKSFEGAARFATAGCVTLTTVTTPPNDDICNATALTLDAEPMSFSNVGASVQDGESLIHPPAVDPSIDFDGGWPVGTNTLSHSVWFTFKTPAKVGKIVVDLTDGELTRGNFNTQVAVYAIGDCEDFSSSTFLAGTDRSGRAEIRYFSRLISQPELEVFCLRPNTTYYIVVDGNPSGLEQRGLTDRGDFRIQVRAEPLDPVTFHAVANGETCDGDENGSLVVLAEGGGGKFSYAWSTGDTTNAMRESLAAGNYTLTVTDRCGTEGTKSFTVEEDRFGALRSTVTDPVQICEEGLITLNAGIAGGLPYDDDRLFVVTWDRKNSAFSLLSADFSNPMNKRLVADSLPSMEAIEFIGNNWYTILKNTNALFKINVETGEQSVVVDSVSAPGICALSYVPSTGNLYGLSDTAAYRIDPETGSATYVRDIKMPYDFYISAAVDNDEIIHLSNGRSLYTLDINDPSKGVVRVGSLSINGQGGMEMDPNIGELYIRGFTTLGPPETDFYLYARLDRRAGGEIPEVVDFLGMSDFILQYAFRKVNRAYDYSWSPADGLSDATAANPTVMVTESQTFTVTASDECGNSVTTTVEVIVNDTPDSTEVAVEVESGTVFNGVTISGDTVLVDTLVAVTGCDSIVTTTVNATLTGLDERFVNPAGLILYPNPTRGVLTIDARGIGAGEFEARIVDLTGRTHHNWLMSGPHSTHNLADLPVGTYFLELRTVTGFTSKRFVKTR